MNHATVPIGTPIALPLLPSSANIAFGGANLKTLSELLDIWETFPPRELAMLRTTASLLAVFLGKSPDQITIDEVSESRDGFRAYLVSRTYAKNSIRSYVNYFRILLESATAWAWKYSPVVSKEWRGVMELATSRRCLKVVNDLVHSGKSPGSITRDQTEQWIQVAVEHGLSYRTARREVNGFWSVLVDAGATTQAPLCSVRKERYGISLADLPSELRAEIVELLRWKEAKFAIDRPKYARIRPVTSKNLKEVLCSLAGFAINIHGAKDITSLSRLITKDILYSYAEWSLDVREVKPGTMHHALALISGPMNQHPDYRTLDLKWLKTLMDNLPIEPRSERNARKAKKYLEYSVVEAIPAAIRAGRSAAAKKGVRQLAKLVQEELLMLWLPILPWRQRNLRECRIGGPHPNLFKGPVGPLSAIDRPAWVVEVERINPNTTFWQFKFSPDETKTGVEVEALVPRQLIELLEEFIQDFRPMMLNGDDPGTLFVNKNGKMLSQQCVTNTISSLTLRYAGRRVTPHLFRDVVAYAWLKEHPSDYLSLSKLFWHSSVQMVTAVYGSRFNESSGVCAMETWRTERETKTT
jgi:integrase